MIVRRRGSVFKFRVADGWTRQAVANLLLSKDIRCVVPRFSDVRRDKAILDRLEEWKLPTALSQLPCDDCDHFVVYQVHQHWEEVFYDQRLIVEGTLSRFN